MRQIWLLKDHNARKVHPISPQGTLTIGRSPRNDVVVNVSGVSRHHAQIIGDSDGNLHTHDLNSVNGTFINEQRITGSRQLNPGDTLRIGSHIFTIERGTSRSGLESLSHRAASLNRFRSGNNSGVLVGSILIVTVALALILFGGQSKLSSPAQPPAIQSTGAPQIIVRLPTLPPAQIARERALAATVLVAPTEEGWGSGSIIDPRGYILTNAHVVFDIDNIEIYRYAKIFINPPGANDAPEFRYIVETIEYDLELDLALLKIVTDQDGNELLETELDLAAVPIGNPRRLQHQDILTIMGFPGTGGLGGSVTVTTGTVAGFENEKDITNAWIKTDAEISMGNSGGLALDENYALIGIPTAVNVNPTGKLGYIHSIQVAESILAKIPN